MIWISEVYVMFLGLYLLFKVCCILYFRVWMNDCVIVNCWNVIVVLYVGIVDLGLVVNEWGL